jgi:hypothetical protein
MDPAPPLIARNRTCPCDCSGNGELVFLSCPACGTTVFLCDEIGNVFDDIHDPLKSGPLVIYRSARQRCPACGKALLSSFQFATSNQLYDIGLTDEHFTFADARVGTAVQYLRSL